VAWGQEGQERSVSITVTRISPREIYAQTPPAYFYPDRETPWRDFAASEAPPARLPQNLSPPTGERSGESLFRFQEILPRIRVSSRFAIPAEVEDTGESLIERLREFDL